MDGAAVLIFGLIGLAVLTILLLPLRKRWNDDGASDAYRRQAVQRELWDGEDE